VVCFVLETIRQHEKLIRECNPAHRQTVQDRAMWFTDLRYALRLLRSRPAFTAAAVITLALGLGANTAMFSVIRAVLLRPLPYAMPERLVRIVGFDRASGERENLSPADFLDFAREARTLERTGAHGWVGFLTVVDSRGEPERVGGVSVTEGFFPTLGAGFALGRSFTADEDRPGGPRAVVLGHGFWQRRYGADPSVVGRTILVNQQQATIVGVLDARFRHVEINPEREADMYVPYRFDTLAPNRGGHFIRAVGRLAPGATADSARAELVTIAERLEKEYPRDNTNQSVALFPLYDAIVEDARPALLMLAGAVAFVLLVACANLANLLLAQGARRRGEIAVRVALGAPRARLVRQLLIESVTLSAAGAAAGVALAFLAMPLLTRLQSAGVPGAADIRLDGVVLVFTTIVTLGTGLAIGLLPALQFSRGDVHETVRETTRGLARGGMRQHARELLIASQMALALMLLAGAGLMMRSLWHLQGVDTGFSSAHVLTFETALATATYAEGEQIPFYDRFYDRIRALPGVVSVGASNILPLSANYDSRGVQIETAPAPPGQAPSIQARSVSPDYFKAIGVPLLEGRTFTDRDRENSPLVVIVSTSMARRYWPGQRAVGQRVTFNSGIPPEAQQEVGGPGSREVVGVVGDVKHLGLDEADVPMFYTPQAQQPSYHTMALVVRTSTDPAGVTSAIRAELAGLDATVPLYRVRTLDDVLQRATAEPRMRASLLGIFAALALVLAAVGVYGVIGYVVGQRTQEIALRLALGAGQRTVLRWIFLEGLRPVVLGLIAGVAGALGATRVVAGMLFQISPTDAPTYAAVVALLLGIACIAVWIPARRAATVNPMEALRSD
jgi:putative ABC transport system permease protein